MRALLYLALNPKRLLTLIAGIVGAAVYVWIAAVRAAPRVRARKTTMRETWQSRERTRP